MTPTPVTSVTPTPVTPISFVIFCNHEMRSCDLKRLMKRKDHNLIHDSAKHTALPERENETTPAEENDIGKYTWKKRGVEKNHAFLL